MKTTETATDAKAMVRDLSTEITDLNCLVRQMSAVACSFAGDYVDITDYQLELAVKGDPDGYRDMFNAFCTLMALVRDKADQLDALAAGLHGKLRDAE